MKIVVTKNYFLYKDDIGTLVKRTHREYDVKEIVSEPIVEEDVMKGEQITFGLHSDYYKNNLDIVMFSVNGHLTEYIVSKDSPIHLVIDLNYNSAREGDNYCLLEAWTQVGTDRTYIQSRDVSKMGGYKEITYSD